jgi:hypothetical protein
MVQISDAETVFRIWSGSDQKVSIMDQNFLKINIILEFSWPKILVGGVGYIANLTGRRFSQSVANVHSDPIQSASGQWHRDSRDSSGGILSL